MVNLRCSGVHSLAALFFHKCFPLVKTQKGRDWDRGKWEGRISERLFKIISYCQCHTTGKVKSRGLRKGMTFQKKKFLIKCFSLWCCTDDHYLAKCFQGHCAQELFLKTDNSIKEKEKYFAEYVCKQRCSEW